MNIDGSWKACPAASFVCSRLNSCGFRALLVGGAVRNAVLGLQVKDIDIATDANPDQISNVFEGSSARLLEHGRRYGMVAVLAEGSAIEVTSFRRDVSTDGRRACVAFTDRIEEDASRRDFTMNAIYAQFDGTLIDPLGGLPDLEARRVRFIGDPKDRILEDRLRMLRLFRFHAHFGDADAGICPDAISAVGELAQGISVVSAERTTAELLTLLAAPFPSQAVECMSEVGLLDLVMPGAMPDSLSRLERLELAAGIEPDSIRRMAAIKGSPNRLRLDRRSAARLKRLSEGSMRGLEAEELGYRFGMQDGIDIALLSAAHSSSDLPDCLAERILEGAEASFPLSAADLPANFKGASIGKSLRTLERRWLDSGFRLSGDELMASFGSQTARNPVKR